MFSGIITALGKIDNIEVSVNGTSFIFSSNELNFSDIIIGDSIAVNGVCLTVVSLGVNSFSADLSKETLAVSNFLNVKSGNIVNLERALTLNTAINGHLVSGHIDSVAEVVALEKLGKHTILSVNFLEIFAKYISVKGSVCLNGVSLTVNEVINNTFKVNIVPHTLKYTNLGLLQIGDSINLEIDMLARYVETILNTTKQ